MFYRICNHIALRSWKHVPFAYYVKNDPYAKGLKKEEFALLRLCDGEHDLPESATPSESALLQELAARGLIEECQKGEHPCAWSAPRFYEHRYFPKMNLMITGKCNYNCRHCFNAADNAPLMSEWSFADLCALLDQARDCGIHAFTITGGEPMRHPRFEDILREIIRRDMFVEELNTNGSLITQDLLDRMKAAGCRPLMKISFDGLGCHDWMRSRKGAEERTLAAIRLCVDNGFPVKVQTQVNKKTLDSLLPTVCRMEKMGVFAVRLIRTTEAERWALNAKDATLSLTEYYEAMLSFAGAYARGGHHMPVDLWQFLRIFPEQRAMEMVPVLCNEGRYRDAAPVCKGNRGMIGVTSEGDVVPCLQMSGYFKDHGICLGNLHTTPLKSLLSEGIYLETICRTVGELRSTNPKCGSCPYFVYCCGGCRALGLLFSGEQQDMAAPDLSKCLFFENGWHERVASLARECKYVLEQIR